MYRQYNPFLQPYQPQQRGMDNYMQDVQSSRAMQNMDPRLQQEAMARQQFELQNYMDQQRQGMQQNPFAGLSQQQQDMLGQFGYQQQMEDMQSARAGQANIDPAMGQFASGPQQPGPNFGPQQPGPQFGARPPQNGFAPGPWGAGGPSQMLQGPSGSGSPMNPGNRQPPQHWTPPSVNMPMSQRDQPWMGGQSQLAAQYGGQNFGQRPNPFQQINRQGPNRSSQRNPFQGNMSEMRMEPGKTRQQSQQPTQQPAPTMPSSSGRGGSGAFATGPMPGSGFNPFSRMGQQRQVSPSFNQR